MIQQVRNTDCPARQRRRPFPLTYARSANDTATADFTPIAVDVPCKRTSTRRFWPSRVARRGPSRPRRDTVVAPLQPKNRPATFTNYIRRAALQYECRRTMFQNFFAELLTSLSHSPSASNGYAWTKTEITEERRRDHERLCSTHIPKRSTVNVC